MTTKGKIWRIACSIIALIIFCSLLFAYFRYVTLKNALVMKLSEKASALSGHTVKIGDLSFGPSATVNLYDIIVHNPAGFPEGQLLRVKKISLQANAAEILKGKISIKAIEIVSPAFSLTRDDKNRLNISDKLRELFTKKGASTAGYRIDSFKVRSGTFDMNKDSRCHVGDISVTMQPLSSDRDIKTVIEVKASPPGESRLSVKGFAYLNSDPKKIDLSVLWKDIRLAPIEDLVGKKISVGDETRNLNVDLRIEGDTKNGISLRTGIKMKEGGFRFLSSEVKDIFLNIDAIVSSGDSVVVKNALLSAGGRSTVRLDGAVKDMNGTPFLDAKVRINLPDLSMIDAVEGLKVRGSLASDAISIKGSIGKALPVVSGMLQLTNASVEYGGIRLGSAATRITVNGSVEGSDSLKGGATIYAKNFSVLKTEGNKTLIKNASADADLAFRGKNLDIKVKAGAGKITASLSGSIRDFMGEGRAAKIRFVLPDSEVAEVRSAFWDAFPDKLLYAGLNGSVAANFSASYSKGVFGAEGQLRLKGVKMEGENGEYTIGPVDGAIPIVYAKGQAAAAPPFMPSFERPEFENLGRYYDKLRPEEGSSRISVGSLRYGFKLLDNIEVRMKQKGNYLNISSFDANIFGSRLNGSAVIEISDGVNFRAGMLVKGLSLTRVCDDITPIKGYISGKVDGLALVKGSSADMNALIGRADFWSYGAGGEKTKISKEFLQKIGGPQMKSYIGERAFDKGTVSLYLQNGFLIFKELEISHRNLLGITDLSVKVAPFNNRIALDHLMSTIAEAAERAAKKE